MNWLSRGLQKANVIPNHQQLKNQEHEKNNSPYGGMPLLHRQRIRTVGGVRPRQFGTGHHQHHQADSADFHHSQKHAGRLHGSAEDFQQGKVYYDALKAVHDVVKGGIKVKKSIELVAEISEIYVRNYQNMLLTRTTRRMNSPPFQPGMPSCSPKVRTCCRT